MSNVPESHGATNTPEYRIWQGMISRCRYSTDTNWPKYGARGIRVCKRWEKFSRFIEDMGLRPSSTHTIERKNNDGDYTPMNCAWVPHTRQANNRRSTRWVVYMGKRKSLADWSRDLGMNYGTLKARLKRGWTMERAVSEAIHANYRGVGDE